MANIEGIGGMKIDATGSLEDIEVNVLSGNLQLRFTEDYADAFDIMLSPDEAREIRDGLTRALDELEADSMRSLTREGGRNAQNRD